MARNVNGGTANLGKAMASAVADAVSHVMNATHAHQQAAKTQMLIDAATSASEGGRESLARIAQKCLDTGEVHEVLEPIFRLLKGE